MIQLKILVKSHFDPFSINGFYFRAFYFIVR